MARHAHELHEPAVVEIEDDFSRCSPDERLVLTRQWVEALESTEPVEFAITGAQMVAEARDEAGWGNVVDLWGRLSNPSEAVETLADQGWNGRGSPPRPATAAVETSRIGDRGESSEQKGRLSNPGPGGVQRRLSDAEIEAIVGGYRAGRTLADLATEFGVHPRTVADHLEARGVQRRVNRRKMSEGDISQAAARYRRGESLVMVTSGFDVDAATVRRALLRVGVTIRPRPGWA